MSADSVVWKLVSRFGGQILETCTAGPGYACTLNLYLEADYLVLVCLLTFDQLEGVDYQSEFDVS